MTDVLLDSLEEMYDEYLPIVYGYARSRLPEADAEDVTAEVFRAAAERLRHDPDAALLRGWFLTAARNRIIDMWRRDARWERRIEVLRRDAELAGADVASADHEPALEALHQLAPDHRTVLLLRYVDGLRSREIADALGRNARAVDSLVARARRAFANAYAEAVA
jgi:RNA polymerase sigma-70 factor (ECF subfamily)